MFALDDTYPIGTVELIVMENGERVLKKDIRLWFGPKDGSWKLGNLYSVSDQEELLEALSGRCNKLLVNEFEKFIKDLPVNWKHYLSFYRQIKKSTLKGDVSK